MGPSAGRVLDGARRARPGPSSWAHARAPRAAIRARRSRPGQGPAPSGCLGRKGWRGGGVARCPSTTAMNGARRPGGSGGLLATCADHSAPAPCHRRGMDRDRAVPKRMPGRRRKLLAQAGTHRGAWRRAAAPRLDVDEGGVESHCRSRTAPGWAVMRAVMSVPTRSSGCWRSREVSEPLLFEAAHRVATPQMTSVTLALGSSAHPGRFVATFSRQSRHGEELAASVRLPGWPRTAVVADICLRAAVLSKGARYTWPHRQAAPSGRPFVLVSARRTF